ncbi:AsnC family transcriptional regulator [Azotosporobacter soli]|uniref:siroheme decarboxylase subunit beta n=1 Tax=Azotosporobacter soli TaxID=3055040 RepID=UPI0031FE9B30
MLDQLDKKIIAAMQDDFPLVPEPYQQIAAGLGISQDELLRRLASYVESGKIRKMGAVLRHREVGYAANALCAWIVPEEEIGRIGKLFAAEAAVTHCYSRIAPPDWPYNFYTMVHAHDREECNKIAARLSTLSGLQQYIMLYSTREWKKNSMQYFREGEETI